MVEPKEGDVLVLGSSRHTIVGFDGTVYRLDNEEECPFCSITPETLAYYVKIGAAHVVPKGHLYSLTFEAWLDNGRAEGYDKEHYWEIEYTRANSNARDFGNEKIRVTVEVLPA